MWFVAALAAAAVISPPAGAQTMLDGAAYAFPVPDYVGGLVGVNSLDPGLTNGKKAKKKRAKHKRMEPPTRRQLAALRFKPSASVTQGVYQRVLDEAGEGVDPALVTAQLDAAKASFRAVMKRLHWRVTDVGDMAAFSFVQGYITWHEDGVVPRRGMKVLRRDVRANLARRREVRRLSDARRQEIAEMLELRVIFFLDQRDDALRAGESTAVARAEMREWTESIFGVDVNHVRLTKRGLVKR
jgi:hypothetical protein